MARRSRSVHGGNIAVRLLVVLVVVAAAAGGGLWYWLREPPPPADPIVPATSAGDVTQQVHEFCGACHGYPPADTFPRWAWKDEVERGYNFAQRSTLRLKQPR